MNDKQMKLAHILLVEDNEGDILLTKEAFEECRVKKPLRMNEFLDAELKSEEFCLQLNTLSY